jgi:hypothetical protein
MPPETLASRPETANAHLGRRLGRSPIKRQPSRDGKRALRAGGYDRRQSGAVSGRMSIRQPVSRAASRAF